MIKISICLTDLPADKITKSEKNNKKYISLIVDERREPDTYGNTHTVYVDQTKEERTAKANKSYVGNGKELVFDRTNQNFPTKATKKPAAQITEPLDDLPF